MGKVIKYILSFMLMIGIIASSLIGIVAHTIGSKEYCLNKMQEIDFYNKTEAEIRETFLNYIPQSGMEESVVQDIFDSEKLKQDVNLLIDAIYDNKKIEIDTNSVKEKLTQNINNYAQAKGIKIKNQDEVTIFINTIVEAYESGIVFSMSVIEQVTPITSKIVIAIKQVEPIVYIATVVLALILIITNWKKPTDILKYIGMSMLTSGIILTVIKIYILNHINVENIAIMTNAVTDLIHNVVNQILNTIFYMGIAIAIIGFIGIVVKIISIKNEEEKPKEKSKEKPKAKHA